jgi:beta-phosphoglucomutase
MSHLPRAFIFDLDGVIVNTVDLHYRAWKHLFDDLGVPFTRRDMDQMRGVQRRDILLSYTSGFNEAQIAACLAQKDHFYKRVLAEASREIMHAPVVDLIHAAKRRGLKVGVASSSVNARIVLESVQLLPLFDALADGNTVCRSKPAPDIFVWVAGALGVSPRDAVVVEDGSAGIEGARAAGMFVVGLDVDTDRPLTVPPNLHLTMSTLSFRTIAAHYRRHAAAPAAAV